LFDLCFRDESCEFLGELVLEKTVTDYHSCQEVLQSLGELILATYFVYDSSSEPDGHTCRLYNSWARSCTTVMGPAYPAYEECFDNEPISSSSSTASTTSAATQSMAPSSSTPLGTTTTTTSGKTTTRTTTVIKTTTTTTQPPVSGCERPEDVPHGTWVCPAKANGGGHASCYLDCTPGYAIASIITTCNEEEESWSPPPASFTCSPAVLLLVGGSGGRPGGPAVDPTAVSVELVSLEDDCSGLKSGPGNLPTPRTGAVAAAADGQLLVCGGTDGEIDTLDDCLTWDMAASPAASWSHHSYLNEGRMGGSVARLLNTLYASGGSAAVGGGIEHLDPAADGSKWQFGPSLPAGVRSVTGHCSLPWGGDGLLLIGGVYTTSEIIVSRDVLLYNTTTMRWSSWPSLLTRRRNLACTRLDATHILVAGGDNDSGDAEVGHMAEILEVGGSGSWRPVGRLTMGRKGAKLAVINGGRAVIAGGYSTEAASFLNTIEEFSLETESWSMLEKRLLLPRGAYGFSIVPDSYC
jgi:hypothetical protein